MKSPAAYRSRTEQAGRFLLTTLLAATLSCATSSAKQHGTSGDFGEQLSLLRPPDDGITSDEIFLSLLNHNRLRDVDLQQYSALRTYVASNAKGKVYAKEVIRVQYRAPDTKAFETMCEEGSRVVRDLVFKKLIESEVTTSKGREHRDSSIKPANYTFRLLGQQDLGPYHCWVVQAVPKRMEKYLFAGRIWIDQQEFGIVQIVGRPAQSPSFWVRHVNFQRQYQKIGEFWLPRADTTIADLRIFGRRILTIEHGNYAINGAEARQALAENPTGERRENDVRDSRPPIAGQGR